MSYLVNTIVKYILRESTAEAGTFRFVLPSYPSDILLAIGERLEERFSRISGQRIRFEYGIACRLGKEWEDLGADADRRNFAVLSSKGWYNQSNNLTSLRNKVKDSKDDCLLILLAGYEHIDDRASLQDFFHLDQQAVWEICLQKSFRDWVVASLETFLDRDDGKSDFKKIAEMLKTLYEYGLTDTLEVSRYLERQDFSAVMQAGDPYRIVLNNLSPFRLPCMIGLAKRSAGKAKSFSRYLTWAQDFFNYSMFLESSKRKKNLQKIREFKNKFGAEEPSNDILGSFRNLAELLKALEIYVENQSKLARQQLLEADFIYIYEKILNYKRAGGGTSKQGPKFKKLAGLPPEVFLRALWITLGDFKRRVKKHAILMEEDLRSITLESTAFRHDFDAGEEKDDTKGDNDLAKTFLCRILGGIDAYLERQLRVELGESKDYSTLVNLNSHLCPEENSDELSYTKTSTAEPLLKFKVVVYYGDDNSFKREFAWLLPQNHQCRLLVNLYGWALDEYRAAGDALPVFELPSVAETLMTSEVHDEEEVNRLLNIALQKEKGRSMTDLLTVPGIDDTDEVKKLLLDLARDYQYFLSEFKKSGFFTALDDRYNSLRKAYDLAYDKYLINSERSNFGPLLIKAFMITASSKARESKSNWIWHEYLEAAVVTPLHPAVLEMLHHQHTYLCESFCFHANRALKEPGNRMFAETHWNMVADLARIQWPVFGTLKDLNKNLATNVRSYNYIHLVGESSETCSLITSRTLLEYDDGEDEEISDVELFRETRASQLIKQVLQDYRKLYAFADDGLSMGAYCGRGIQPIIAGIDTYLASVFEKGRERIYALKLTIFSNSRDDLIIHWINAWKDRWQRAELSGKKQHYNNCKISIAYRIMSKNEFPEQFKSLLQDTNLDLLFFTDFIEPGASHFELFKKPLDIPEGYSKFPVLEKACCRVTGGGKEKQRERVLINHRFRLGALHAEVMAYLKSKHFTTNKHTVMSINDFQPWVEIINTAHESSVWVVCIDPSVDELLLQRIDTEGVNLREIIGFGTGVGAYGENNYTISTEQFAMVDIKKKVAFQISNLLELKENNVCMDVAECLMKEAVSITGLSLVKATGPSDRFVREFIANTMVRKMLPWDSSAFCDLIVSLDAFLHWFNDKEDEKRPDLLRLRAHIVDGYFEIEAQIIECKLAQQSKGFLEKARQQVESGLKQLMAHFSPREGRKPLGVGVNIPPDQRYWWMQLHRLIASKGEVSRPQYDEALMAMEYLSEGFFTINWQAAVIAFWTDLDSDSLNSEPEWDFSLEGESMQISVVTAGRNFIKKVCLENIMIDVFTSDSGIKYSFKEKEEELAHNGDIGASKLDEPKPDVEFSSQTSKLIKEEKLSQKEKSNIGDTKDELEKSTAHGVVLTRSIPERILLGSGTAGGRDIYWEFGHPDLPNRHIIIFGSSGTGKTYTIQALLCELAKLGQNSLIVDYTNGFTTIQLEEIAVKKLNPRQHIIRREPLTVNPFRRQCDFIDDIQLEEDPSMIAQRVSGVFAEVYQLGNQQKSALYSAIREGVTQKGNDFHMGDLMLELEDIRSEGGPTASSAASVISKIQPFVDMNPFGEEDIESWEKIFKDNVSRCHIIQLAGFMKDTSRLITEFSLVDLYWYYRARGSKDEPKIIVLDEIQNLVQRLESPLGQFLTEGRKFGISLILATQTLSNLEKEEKDRLFQASHKLFFKPADTEIRSFAQLLSDATPSRTDEWIDRLSALKRGECYSLGHAFNKATGKLEVNVWSKIRIRSLEERFYGG